MTLNLGEIEDAMLSGSQVADRFFNERKPKPDQFILEGGETINSRTRTRQRYWPYQFNVMFAVTDKRIKMDKNKRIFFKNNGRWENVTHLNDWCDRNPILNSICDTCNCAHNEILERLNRSIRSKSSHGERNLLENIRNLPEFVMWRRSRQMEHKRYEMKFVGVRKGGNCGRTKPRAASRIPQLCVYEMLRRFGSEVQNDCEDDVQPVVGYHSDSSSEGPLSIPDDEKTQ